MTDTFESAFEFVMKWEGGDRFHEHPDDPGGATKYGISIRFAGSIKLDLDQDGDTDKEDIRALTRDYAKTIYETHFWDKAHCGWLAPALGFAVFDAAVNTGPPRAVRFLQKAVGAKPDGVIGVKTLERVDTKPPAEVLWQMTARRNLFYGHLGHFKTFGHGWLNRSAECHSRAMLLAL